MGLRPRGTSVISLPGLLAPLALPLTPTCASVQPLPVDPFLTLTLLMTLTPPSFSTPLPALVRAPARPVILPLTLVLTLFMTPTPPLGRNGLAGALGPTRPFPLTLSLASTPTLSQTLAVFLWPALALTLNPSGGPTLGPNGPGRPRLASQPEPPPPLAPIQPASSAFTEPLATSRSLARCDTPVVHLSPPGHRLTPLRKNARSDHPDLQGIRSRPSTHPAGVR